jgi:hypothetical protein
VNGFRQRGQRRVGFPAHDVPLRPFHLIADPAVEVRAAESEESGRATALGAAVNADEQVGNELRHEPSSAELSRV